jgi:hypothetical protein
MAGRFFWSTASDYLGRKQTYFVFGELHARLSNRTWGGQRWPLPNSAVRNGRVTGGWVHSEPDGSAGAAEVLALIRTGTH